MTEPIIVAFAAALVASAAFMIFWGGFAFPFFQ